MSVKRFVAADMRRALELVRQEMGPDAIILSSRRVKQGVEILTSLEPVPQSDQPSVHEHSGSQEVAMGSDDAWSRQVGMDRAVASHVPAVAARAPAPRTEPVFAHATGRGMASGKTSTELAAEIERARDRMMAAKKARSVQEGELTLGEMAAARSPVPPTAAPAPRRAPIFNDDDDMELGAEHFTGADYTRAMESQPRYQNQAQHRQLEQLQAELADMRLLLEDQLGRIARAPATAANPMQASLERRLQRLGLSESAAQPLAQDTREQRDIRTAWGEVLGRLAHQIPVLDNDIVARGGVFAFVGPTGVGKTTTIAKLAARHVLARGADKVALITTDTFRIAAHDQLRTLGRILNVQVKVVNDTEDLGGALSQLRGCELVLIDTAGMRHGDPLLRQQLADLQSLSQVQTLLVMSANSQIQMLKATQHAYQGAGLRGCILTKLDETASLGEALGVIMEKGLPLVYTTDGQEIPRDLSLAKGHQLVSRAIALAKAAQTAPPAARQQQAAAGKHFFAGANPASHYNAASNYTDHTYQPY